MQDAGRLTELHVEGALTCRRTEKLLRPEEATQVVMDTGTQQVLMLNCNFLLKSDFFLCGCDATKPVAVSNNSIDRLMN